MKNLEDISMAIIVGAGEARALSFRAIECARNNDFEQAHKLLEDAKTSSLSAHNAQTELLVDEARGEENTMNILLVHAQDHLMTSLLAQEMASEIIHLYETKQDKEVK